MASPSLISIISWCRSIICFLFSKGLVGSDPTADGKDPNADHANAPNDVVNGSSRGCRRKHELLEQSVSDF